MTIFALEQCVENGVDLNTCDAESALAEINTLRTQLAETQRERDTLLGLLLEVHATVMKEVFAIGRATIDAAKGEKNGA